MVVEATVSLFERTRLWFAESFRVVQILHSHLHTESRTVVWTLQGVGVFCPDRLTYEVGDLELTSQYVGAYCEIPGDTVVDRILDGTGKI